MVSEVQGLADNWMYDVVFIGYPGPILRGCPVAGPHQLGRGSVGFDLEKAFHSPVRLVNGAAMQTLGSDEGGEMLFPGLGTGLTALPSPWNWATFLTGRDLRGIRRGTRVGKVPPQKMAALCRRRGHPPVRCSGTGLLILGGGNAKELKQLSPGSRTGENTNAFQGGFHLWEKEHKNGSTRRTTLH